MGNRNCRIYGDLAFLAYFTMLRNVGDMRRLVKEQNSLFAPIYFITTALLGFSLISFTVFVGLWTHTAGGDDVVLFFQFSFIGLIFLIDAIRTFSSHSIGKHLKNSFTTTNFITIPAVVYGYTYGGEFGGLVAIAFLFMGYIVFFPSLWILSLIFEPSSRKNPAKNEIHDPDPL